MESGQRRAGKLRGLGGHCAHFGQRSVAMKCHIGAGAEDCPAAACTLVDGVLLVRLRGATGEGVRNELQRIWHALRPAFTGLAPHSPRIWAT